MGLAGDDARGPGDARADRSGPWLDAWNASADILWDAWGDELWLQDLYGSPLHIFGPAHGFAGNVLVLARGGALDQARRRELERRAVRALARHAIRADGLAQWPPSLEPSSQEARTQWCHGAPGIVASCATLAPGDAELDELLLAGGELTWRAGPLRKGASLCHGTAGNGYAFLKLFERTGDELWLERARAFAMHAVAQVEQGLRRARTGPSHALDRRPRDGPLRRELPLRDGRVPDDRPLLSSGSPRSLRPAGRTRRRNVASALAPVVLRCRPSSPNHECPLEYAFQSATTSCGHRLPGRLDRDVRRVVDGAGLTERDPDDALHALRQRGSHHAVDALAIALRRLVVADVHDQHVAEPAPVAPGRPAAPSSGSSRCRCSSLRRGGGTPRGRASTRTRASAAAGRPACRGSRRRPSRRRTSRGAVVTVRRSQRSPSPRRRRRRTPRRRVRAHAASDHRIGRV